VTTRLSALPSSDGLPLVALQHNPLYVGGQHDYPFELANTGQVLEEYRQGGVILSLSGHCHPGQPLRDVAGVPCYTVPAACERPFRFAHLRLEGTKAEITELALDIGTTDGTTNKTTDEHR
jgi:hypothetical protein